MANSLARWTNGRPVITVSELDQRSSISEWLVLGPYPFDTPNRFARALNIGETDAITVDPTGVERTVSPVEGQPHENAAVPNGFSYWERLSGEPQYSLAQRFPGHTQALAYAATYLHATEHERVVLRVRDWENGRRCLTQVFLDGVPIGNSGAPIVLNLDPGEHCLLLKIAGSSTGNTAWHIIAEMGWVQPLTESFGVGLIQPSGFWRGDEGTPRVEIDTVVVNTSRHADTIPAIVASQTGNGPASITRILEPGAATSVRLSAPIGANQPGAEVDITISAGETEIPAVISIPKLPDPGVIHVVEGFHCDPVWVSDQHHYNLVSLENVRQLVDACLANPAYRAFVHEIDYLKPFMDEYPDYRAVVFGLIQRGQISVGSSYNEPNENNCSGEGIIRNILYGHAYHRHFLGGDPLVYHAWDVFGHIPQLSQILAKSGLIGVIWSKHIYGFPPIFSHISPDGTAVPHIRTPYGWGTYSIDRLRETVQPLLAEKQSYGMKRHLVMDSGDFTSPSAWMVGHTDEMTDSYPPIVMTSPEDYLQGHVDDGAWFPRTSRNPSQYHIGTQHSRSEMKIANRLAENTLFAAEAWSTFASLMGATYPHLAVDKAWRQVLFGQHHDALTGTPCDTSYLDLMNGYREAIELAMETRDSAQQYIATGIEPSAKGTDVVVFNPLSWPRGGAIRVPVSEDAVSIEIRTDSGEVLPAKVIGNVAEVVVADVPAVGYTTITLTKKDQPGPKADSSNDDCIIENEYWRIKFDPARGGGIESLVDKDTGKEYIDADIGVGNDLAAFKEKGARTEASWEFWTTGERCFASDCAANVEIEKSGVGTIATITGMIGDIATYRRTVSLRSGRREIVSEVVLDDYRGRDDLFAVTTPVAVSGAMPVFEDRFCSVVARRGRRQFDYRTGGPNIPSECDIFPVYNWVEAGWSTRVDVGNESSMNLGMMGLIVPHDETTESTLEPLMAAFNHAGITCTPYYDDDDQARIDALQNDYPEFSQFENTMKRRLDDIPMAAQWMGICIDGRNPYVMDLKERLPERIRNRINHDMEERGWGMVIVEDDRVPDGWPPMPTILLCAYSSDEVHTVITKIGEDLARDGRILFESGCDFRAAPEPVDNCGLAMLTTGTGAASLEPDGTLTLFLTHTSDWSESHLSHHLIPEHRSMSFSYAFYPHTGSWRESDVVRAGYEFNNPLTVTLPENPTGKVPREQSFLTFDEGGVVVTAIKPAANPIARFENDEGNPSQHGVIVRAYESTGRGARGKLKLGRPIEKAFAASLMEQDRGEIEMDGSCVNWSLGPFSIETVRLVPDTDTWPDLESADLGRKAEAVQPVWCRSWSHNAGAHPLGYLPVGIFVEGDLPIENEGGNFPTVGRIRVSIVNNLTDSDINGTAELIIPDRWTALPTAIPYNLGPREHSVIDVTIALDGVPHVGLIKARLKHGGQVYQDVLEVGRRQDIVIGGGGGERLNRIDIEKERDLEWTVLRDGDDIVVRVTNPWWETLDAELTIVTPLEMWGEEAERFEIASVYPRTVGLNVPPHQNATVRFGITGGGGKKPTFWAWAKLAHHGKADYKPVPGTTA
jgi:alpha-mannosidase